MHRLRGQGTAHSLVPPLGQMIIESNAPNQGKTRYELLEHNTKLIDESSVVGALPVWSRSVDIRVCTRRKWAQVTDSCGCPGSRAQLGKDSAETGCFRLHVPRPHIFKLRLPATISPPPLQTVSDQMWCTSSSFTAIALLSPKQMS